MSFDKKRKLKRPVNNTYAEICPGSVVRSRSGRSRGRVYAVIDTQTDGKGKVFAKIANGTDRKVENAKKKSVFHLEIIGKETVNNVDDGQIIQLLEKYMKTEG